MTAKAKVKLPLPSGKVAAVVLGLGAALLCDHA